MESLLTVLCPTVCSIGVGLIAYGTQVFTFQSGLFQLGVNAVIVGILVGMARRWPVGRFLRAAVLIVAALTGLNAGSGPRIMLHTSVLLVMWVGVVLLNVRVLSECRWVQAVGQYIAWSVTFALGFFGAGVVLLVFFRPAETTPYLGFYGQLAALTGIGLGIGFKTQDWLLTQLRRQPPDNGCV